MLAVPGPSGSQAFPNQAFIDADAVCGVNVGQDAAELVGGPGSISSSKILQVIRRTVPRWSRTFSKIRNHLDLMSSLLGGA